MHNLVYKVFKCLLLSMLFIIVFDVTSYLYRAMSLNQRMESIMVSMQKVVMENNYLPEESYEMYESLFKQLRDDMNSNGNKFILGYNINYKHTPRTAKNWGDLADSTMTQMLGRSVSRENWDMDLPAKYGDIKIVQVQVGLCSPAWQVSHNNANGKQVDVNKLPDNCTIFTYNYYVPCLNYQATTQATN